MNFSFSEDQVLLRSSVRAALDEQCTPARVRAMMDDVGVDRDGQRTRQMHDDVPGGALQFAGAGQLRRGDKPRGDSAVARGSFHRAIDLGQIDAAAGRR